MKQTFLILTFFLSHLSIGQTSEIDSTILISKSAFVDNMEYTAIVKDDYQLYLRDSSGKTILIIKSYPDIEFIDFDNDGFKDLIINFVGYQDLILYDSKSKQFERIANFVNYPNPKPIMGTKYFYSYHKSGCADNVWDSDLFYIEDFRTVKIGNIHGHDCDNEPIENGIYIYKIQGENKDPIRTLPIDTLNQYSDYKWGFIADFWIKNFKMFE